jgi:betaine-aldehyde dehydrogenase
MELNLTTPVYQNFIHGRFLANQSGETFAVKNPATDEVIYHVEVADGFIQDAAIQSAKQGFAVWSLMTPIERSRILLKAVTLLRERNDELARIEVLDTGKPWQEAECVDVQTGADVIEYFAGLAPALVHGTTHCK